MRLDSTQLRDFAARYTKAWCSQDAASVAEFFSLHGSLSVNDGNPAIGRDEIAVTAQSFMTTFPDLHIGMDDLRVDGDRIEYHWTLAGTNDGPAGTGKTVRISGFEEWQFGSDGLISISQGHFDIAEYERQVKSGI